MTINLTDPIFNDETAAREFMEAQRWPDGPYCPHCGATENIKRLEGKSHRPGLYQCNACRGHFSVTVGTVYERSKVPLTKWLLAVHLLTASKKGMSSHQIHRMLGVTYKTAWFMTHRIREAMTDASPKPMGGGGKAVEVDETYFGKTDEPRAPKKKRATPYTRKGHGGPANKRAVVALVERGGMVRSFHPDRADIPNVREIVFCNISREATLNTDESGLYKALGKEFAKHATVKHTANEYVRGDAHTNTIEGFFSIFKRGMKGVYQHCGEQHLHRYLTEFDFRYNNRTALGVDDAERAAKAIKGAAGKRLTYRRLDA
jgi:transposase-like protein